MFWRAKKDAGKEEPMDKTTRAKMYTDYLRGEGYAPQVDKDGDITFKYEGGTYYIFVSEKDPDYFQLVFPNFWSIESDQERVKVEGAALVATKDTKVAKVYPVRNDVWAAVELFCSPAETFKAVFPRSLSALRTAVSTFTTKMRE